MPIVGDWLPEGVVCPEGVGCLPGAGGGVGLATGGRGADHH